MGKYNICLTPLMCQKLDLLVEIESDDYCPGDLAMRLLSKAIDLELSCQLIEEWGDRCD